MEQEGSGEWLEGHRFRSGASQSEVQAWALALPVQGGASPDSTADGGATAVNLSGFGNSRFLSQERNNREIADHIEVWLYSRGLG